MRTSRTLEALADRIERAEALDRPAALLATAVGKVVRPGPIEDTLSGVPAGHPVHPAVVAMPIGAWLCAGVFDVLGDADSARRLIAIGCAGFLPAAATGAADYRSTDGAERRVGFVHFLGNYAAATSYGLSWVARRRGRHRTGVALSVAGAVALGLAGWLGGHLSYAYGVGVDTTAFQQLPTTWTDVADVTELAPEGRATVVDADGVPLLVTRRGAEWVAFSDRCTHRGAPLHEGTVAGGCIVCPWHGSEFSLDDGSVRSGPASRPQPLLETRVQSARLEVRRIDRLALRTNPTGR